LTSNTLYALLAHPEQWAAVVDQPALAARAVEEGLRWDGPLHCTERIALRPQVLDGVAIPDGALVNVVLAAANRDPVRFADPDQFDIEREPVSNLGFGFGPHYCIGAALGRAEAVTTVRTLAARWPNLNLACDTADVRHRPHLIFRGLTNVPAFTA
jgi:cytochrome P450